MTQRYARQLSLPEMTPRRQKRLSDAHILYVGAGGLGCPALPYLAAAGVGTITIADHDIIDRTNLHRQTVYQDNQTGQSKAAAMAAYLRALNPETKIHVIDSKIDKNIENNGYSLILDGTDNFETKTALNNLSLRLGIALIGASVNQFAGQCGVFAGFSAHYPCYHCLFPELPSDARNCNEAGILGTAAGLTGMYQAHIALCYLLGIGNANRPGTFLSFDFKSMRTQILTVKKNPACYACADKQQDWVKPANEEDDIMVEMLSLDELQKREHIVVDVRKDDEIAADPLPMPSLHMEVSTVPERYQELPKDVTVAFLCAGNIRSKKAAEYVAALGYDNAVILDKFTV